MIEIENLCKNYGPVQAVKNLSLSVSKGEILGLLGPNGAGKSTTLRIIAGFLSPTSGQVTVNGLSVQQDLMGIRKKLGYLPESAALYENMLAFDYLYFIASARGIAPALRLEKIRRAAQRCDIADVIHRPIGELSKGYRQRVGLALALLDDPDILILDEPTTGLDPNQIISIREIIKEFGRDKTVIFSTHILSEAEVTCDRLAIVYGGSIVADGTAAELKQRMSSGSVVRLRLDTRDMEEVERAFGTLGRQLTCFVEGSETVLELELSDKTRGAKEQIRPILKEQDWFLLSLEEEETTLESIFYSLTMRSEETHVQ